MNCLADKITARNALTIAIGRLIIFEIFLILSIFQSSQAQEQWRVFTRYNSLLPSNIIICIAIDSNNIKWLGTDSGLVKFDGNNWTVYNKDNSPLPSNGITALAIDKNHNYWIGTSTGGLVKFNGYNNWDIYDTTNSLMTSNRIHSLSIDIYNIKWIGTGNKGLVRYNDSNWTIYDTSNSNIPGNNIWALKIQNDVKWVGTFGTGLGRFYNNEWIVYNPLNSGIPSYFIRYISTDIQDNIWIATDFSGIAKFNYNLNLWVVYNTSNSGIPSNWTFCILTDNNKKWIGSQNNGLVYYNDTNWINFTPSNSQLPSISVFNLGLDSNRNLWICTGGGLAIYNPNGIVGIVRNHIDLPKNFVLQQNFPNPFNPITTLEFYVSRASQVRLEIYDINGRLIEVLIDSYMRAGEYSVSWVGSKYSSGVYFYKLETDSYSETKKMVLVK